MRPWRNGVRPDSVESRDWRRNLVAVTGASFIGFTSFTLVMPFLPLYFRELGLTDVGAIGWWSGLSLGATPAVTAVLAPAWGRLADRYGRKVMVVRSLASFVVIMSAMAYVTAPWHVLALRLVQGLFAGYGPLAIAMAADCAPPGRLASSIGAVQTAQRLGPAVGPVLGGFLAALLGLRHAFLVSAALYAASLVLMVVLYREGVRPGQAVVGREGAGSTPAVLALPGMRLLIVTVFGLQLVDRSFGPVLPLYLAELPATEGRVALLSGTLFSLTAGLGAAGNALCARLLARWPPALVVSVATLAAAAGALAFAVSPPVPVLMAAAGVFGLAIGVATTAAYTRAGETFPADIRGSGFGVLSSAWLVALAVSPVLAGAAAGWSLPGVFVADAVILIAIAWVFRRRPASSP